VHCLHQVRALSQSWGFIRNKDQQQLQQQQLQQQQQQQPSLGKDDTTLGKDFAHALSLDESKLIYSFTGATDFRLIAAISALWSIQLKRHLLTCLTVRTYMTLGHG
jgi:hypothetical protein